MATSEVLTWLLAGDAAVAYVATRDLRGRDDPLLQSRIATEGAGATILAARGANGHWGRGFYQKWTSSHYTLLQLREIGLSGAHPAARATASLLRARRRPTDAGAPTVATPARATFPTSLPVGRAGGSQWSPRGCSSRTLSDMSSTVAPTRAWWLPS